MSYFYDAKFEGNILIVGQTGCEKTTFVQSLANNNMFRNMKEVLVIKNFTNEGQRGKYKRLFSCRSRL